MNFAKLMLVGLLPLGSGACGTLETLRPDPIIVEAPRPVIPSECLVLPVEPVPVDPETLPELPAVSDWSRATAPQWAVRARRAELAGLQLNGERNAEREARVTNSASQSACAAWAARQQ